MTDFSKLTVESALSGLEKKDFSAVELTQYYLNRIATTDPDLHAFLTLNPAAITEAKAADKLRHQSATNLPPLLGLPYALKDNFLTKNLRTTASARVLDTFIPPYNATVVNKLNQAGAICLGKTNMDAWAHGSSTETSDYGPTKNPWNLDYLPGGSSGGSAAAVAADQCLFAIGSETAGSIRQPAAWCGVTGLKPTYGRVSRYGVVAMASSLDSPGPLTKNAADAGIILSAIAGHDPYDATTMDDIFSYVPLKNTLKPLRIGLPAEYLLAEMDEQVKSLILDAAKVFETLGATVETIHLLDPHIAIGVYTILQRSEVSSNLARYDGIRFGQDRTHFSTEAKRRMMLGAFSLSTGYYDEYYKKAQRIRTLIVEDFARCFDTYDLVLGPTSPGTALKIGATADQPMFGEMQDVLVEASSIAGLASISLPCGFVNGLPVGFQLTGPQQGENTVLSAAIAYQMASKYCYQAPKL